MRGEADLSHLAFVASHFESLQGLYVVPIGAYLLISSIIRYLGWPTPLDVLTLLCACLLQMLSVYADQTLHGSFAGWFVAAWFLILFCFYRGRIRHYLLPAILFFVLAITPGQPYRDEYNWMFGACLIFTGFMDHFLLIRWMTVR
jgi:hypothetical protein